MKQSEFSSIPAIVNFSLKNHKKMKKHIK